ncbi:hypothetical protein BY996DRAFT_8396249 [Phakopsora pachyrhizi]|nr:hypothetical protein BY996DRAFT_8396249 [Phakopsora pachyrhizi]
MLSGMSMELMKCCRMTTGVSNLPNKYTTGQVQPKKSAGEFSVVKKQIELGLLGSSKGSIQLVVLMNLHLKFRNKERTKEIQDLSQSLDMTNDDSRENRREPTRQ